MILKLQQKTLIKSQLIAYILTLFVGVFISLISIQLYLDSKLFFDQETIFNNHSAIVTKQVSVFKSFNKKGIYFTENEIEELRNQPFCKSLSGFKSANFKVQAHTDENSNLPHFLTDLFFESIPDKYLDVKLSNWKWSKERTFVPIIIPESYLKLYNFGFAESQGLPVISKATISEIGFKLRIIGDGNVDIFDSRIVGFSNKINSILVPQNFLIWANKKYGRKITKPNRILIEFNNPSDEKILEYFNKTGYVINKDKLEFGKLNFFYKSALAFVFGISMIIILLSIAFILLSVKLIIQKNNLIIKNLYNIGYSHKQIARFYKMVVYISTIIAVFGAVLVCYFVRNQYLKKLATLFEYQKTPAFFTYIGFILVILLLISYKFILIKNIKKLC